MNLVSIICTKLQYIRLASLFSEIKESSINHFIIDIGYCYDNDIAEIFDNHLDIKYPKYNLDLESENQIEQISNISNQLERMFKKLKLDGIIICGDFNANLAAALTASKLSIPIFCINSGIRSQDRTIPEEINRIVIDHLSSILFCYSEKSVLNLKAEGIENNVCYVGNIMHDVYLMLKDSIDLSKIDQNGFSDISIKCVNSRATTKILNRIINY